MTTRGQNHKLNYMRQQLKYKNAQNIHILYIHVMCRLYIYTKMSSVLVSTLRTHSRYDTTRVYVSLRSRFPFDERKETQLGQIELNTKTKAKCPHQ